MLLDLLSWSSIGIIPVLKTWIDRCEVLKEKIVIRDGGVKQRCALTVPLFQRIPQRSYELIHIRLYAVDEQERNIC